MKLKNILITGLTLAMSQAISYAQSAIPTAKAPDAFGVALHFVNQIPKAGEMQMIGDAGLHWARTDLSWSTTETAVGVYDFSAYDTFLTNIGTKNMKAMFILDYRNALYDSNLSPYDATGRTAFMNWALAAVAHFQGKGIIWELYNEPNTSSFWKPHQKTMDYILLANAVGAAIKGAYPNETFVGPAAAHVNTNDVDYSYLEDGFQNGNLNYFDGVTIHPYRITNPEAAEADYRTLRQIIHRYAPVGKSIPILSGEWGYTTANTGTITDAIQGQYLSRQWLTDIANDVPLSIWYDWHDDNTNPADNEGNYGTVEYTYTAGANPVYTPKPAYNAAKTLNAQLNGFTFNKRIAVGSHNDYVLLFTNGTQTRLAAWTSVSAHSVTIPASAGVFNVTTNTGASGTALTATSTGLTIPLTNDVQYLVPTATNDILRIFAGWDRFPIDAVETTSGQLVTSLSITNPCSSSVTITPPSGTAVTIPAGGTQAFPLTLPVTGPTGGGNGWMTISFGLAYGAVSGLTMTQEAYAQTPLTLTILPLAGNNLPVQVDYLGDTAWSGSVTLSSMTGITPSTNPVSVSFAAGEHRKIVNFPLSSAPSADYTLTAALVQSGTGIQFVRLSGKTYHVTDNFGSYTLGATPPSTAYTLNVGGSGTVASTQTLTVETPPAGLPVSVPKVLKLTYAYDPGSKVVSIVPSSSTTWTIPGTPVGVGMWIYGDGQGMNGPMQYTDSTGQTFQTSRYATISQRVDWDGWKYVTVPFDGTNASHAGGANDGIVHFPVSLHKLYMNDNMDQYQVNGAIYISAPTYLY